MCYNLFIHHSSGLFAIFAFLQQQVNPKCKKHQIYPQNVNSTFPSHHSFKLYSMWVNSSQFLTWINGKTSPIPQPGNKFELKILPSFSSELWRCIYTPGNQDFMRLSAETCLLLLFISLWKHLNFIFFFSANSDTLPLSTFHLSKTLLMSLVCYCLSFHFLCLWR